MGKTDTVLTALIEFRDRETAIRKWYGRPRHIEPKSEEVEGGLMRLLTPIFRELEDLHTMIDVTPKEDETNG